MLINLIYVTFLCYINFVQCENNVIIEIPGGKLRGYFKNNIYEFRMIPYAEPPVGERRFEDPVPYNTQWDGVRDSNLTTRTCIQWFEYNKAEDPTDLLYGDEDCLYLNVYTPAISGDELLPVVVYIHGGAFMFGRGDIFEPTEFLKEKIVMVTLNYRLGPLGFLSTGDNEIAGNMGLKDQSLALRWVKENIHIFGGHSEKITISGFSAGAASVHFHLLSQKSQGLFNAAISHSGTALCAWVLIRNPLEKAKKLAAHLDCSTSSTKALKTCLKGKKAEDIVRSVAHFQPYMYNPFTVFGPVVESKDVPNSFINEDFEERIKKGRTAKVPWIVSYTHDDGGYNAISLMTKDENGKYRIDSLEENWPKLAPIMLFFNDTVPVEKHALHAAKLKKNCLGEDKFSTATYMKTQTLFTDQLFLLGIDKSIKLHVKYSKAPVFVYHYNKSLPHGQTYIMTNRKDLNFGSVHGDDMYIIMKIPFIEVLSKDDAAISKKFADMYISLTDNRTPKYGSIVMPPNNHDTENLKILKINSPENYEVESVQTIIQCSDNPEQNTYEFCMNPNECKL